jgi:hypothetical protein
VDPVEEESNNVKLVLLLVRETQSYKAAHIYLSNKDIEGLQKIKVKA